MELDDTLHRDGDYYALTACPICNFLTQKGMGDVMKPFAVAESTIMNWMDRLFDLLRKIQPAKHKRRHL